MASLQEGQLFVRSVLAKIRALRSEHIEVGANKPGITHADHGDTTQSTRSLSHLQKWVMVVFCNHEKRIGQYKKALLRPANKHKETHSHTQHSGSIRTFSQIRAMLCQRVNPRRVLQKPGTRLAEYEDSSKSGVLILLRAQPKAAA